MRRAIKAATEAEQAYQDVARALGYAATWDRSALSLPSRRSEAQQLGRPLRYNGRQL